jgi:hypothetical protein
MTRKLKLFLTVPFLIVLGVVAASRISEAQSPQEIKPYQVGEVGVPFHMQPVTIYKLVHQGCEVFIAVNGTISGKEAASVAIATGRGCK